MPTGDVGVRVKNGHAGFAGLVSCGSVWICPVCQCKIMARRALEIGSVVAAASAEGIPIGFCTLTLRHGRKDALRDTWDGVAKGWSRATSGKGWALDRQLFDVLGYIRVQEVTYGRNGWHPHVHALFIGEGFRSESDLEEFMGRLWKRWSAGVQSAGLRAPLPQASDSRIVGGDLYGTKLGEYLAKGAGAAGSIGMELTSTQSKIARARHSTHSVWELLDQAIDGEVAGLARWWEWEKASKNRRQISWSRGLRDRFALENEKTDDEIADEELGSVDDTLVVIRREGWATLVQQPLLIPVVLQVAEESPTKLSAWLTGHNIEHWRV